MLTLADIIDESCCAAVVWFLIFGENRAEFFNETGIITCELPFDIFGEMLLGSWQLLILEKFCNGYPGCRGGEIV